MSNSDYPDYEAQRPRRHRITVGDATFIVTTNVNGNKRWVREVLHVRPRRTGGSANVSIYPNGGRKPSATLASLWAHLGIDADARWKECAADHPAFPAKRSIRTNFDDADDVRMGLAAAAALVTAGWSWVADGAGRWVAPPAGIDMETQRDAARWLWVREQRAVTVSVEEADDDGDMAFVSGHTPEELDAAIDAQRDAARGAGND